MHQVYYLEVLKIEKSGFWRCTKRCITESKGKRLIAAFTSYVEWTPTEMHQHKKNSIESVKQDNNYKILPRICVHLMK